MSFANRLPRLPSNLGIVVIRKEGVDQSHRDSCQKVCGASCSTVVDHEQHYYLANHIHIDEDVLAQLPYDGNLSNISSI